MSLVNILKTAITKKDWALVSKALHLLNGDQVSDIISDAVSNKSDQKPFVSNKTSANSKSLVAPSANKFVDDLTLESAFIEKGQRSSTKSYRQPFKEADYFSDVKCSRCGSNMKVTKEEYKFKTIDTESAPFTCIKCIRNSSR